MNVGNWITLAVLFIGAIGIVKVTINDVKLNKENIKKIWRKIDELEDDIKEIKESIGFLRGKLNGKV